MIKFPIKDCDTIPYMTHKEIPVIKAILSAWREYRRDCQAQCLNTIDAIPHLEAEYAESLVKSMAFNCEVLFHVQNCLTWEETEAKKCAKH